jgi:type IV secretory pathway TrbF-like protein
MFRKNNQPVVSEHEPALRTHHDWDDRIKRAHAGETSWKRAAQGVFIALCASAAWNIHQAGETHIQIVHVLHGSTGEVMSVNVANGSSVDPTQAMLAAEMRNWITNVRTVYIDVRAMRVAITHAYDLTDKGSQAEAFLNRYYNDKAKEPFRRAQTETVSVRNPEAVPPPPETIGLDKLQTWDVRWIEDVTSRDGSDVSGKVIAAKVTFKVITPQTYPEAKKDPNGIHIISVSWTD